MAVAVAEYPVSAVASPWLDDEAFVPAAEAERVPSHLHEVRPGSWLWCFQCEYAFQVGDDVACPTPGCESVPFDLWQWDAYGAFAGAEVAPDSAVRYPLAA
jgi:hypothetical protein